MCVPAGQSKQTPFPACPWPAVFPVRRSRQGTGPTHPLPFPADSRSGQYRPDQRRTVPEPLLPGCEWCYRAVCPWVPIRKSPSHPAKGWAGCWSRSSPGGSLFWRSGAWRQREFSLSARLFPGGAARSPSKTAGPIFSDSRCPGGPCAGYTPSWPRTISPIPPARKSWSGAYSWRRSYRGSREFPPRSADCSSHASRSRRPRPDGAGHFAPERP